MVQPNRQVGEERVGNTTHLYMHLDLDTSYDQAGGGYPFDPTQYGEGSAVRFASIPNQQACAFVFDYVNRRIKVYTLAGVEKTDGLDLSAITDVRALFVLV